MLQLQAFTLQRCVCSYKCSLTLQRQKLAAATRDRIVAASADGRKHGALRPQKPLKLIRDGEVGGPGSGIFISNTYLLHCHHRNDSALRRAAV